MNSKRNRKRSNVVSDRLSSLPDDLIHKIFSFIGIKHAIESSALSTRWRFMWTLMPYLNFSTGDFSALPKFSKFVTHVLSGRNSEIEVCSLKLSFRGKVSQVFVKRILNYAFSHNVQDMTITCLHEKKIKFPLSLFSSRSLKHLTLIGPIIDHSNAQTSTWDLPALTTLNLDRVIFCDDDSDNRVDFFSKCTNLKNLTLRFCKINGSGVFSIHHPQLSNFTLENGESRFLLVNVAAPQLKNLSLVLNHFSLPRFSDGLPSLEKVDLCIHNPYAGSAPNIVNLLQLFRGVKFLAINVEVTEALSSSVKLISNQPSPFANLVSLKIYPANIHSVDMDSMRRVPKKVNLSTEVKNYFLDSSPRASLTLVSREEIIIVRNTTSAQKDMAELQVMLDQMKAKMHKQGFPHVESRLEQVGTKRPLHIGGRMAHIRRSWDNLAMEIDLEKANSRSIFTKLECIEILLAELPLTKRVKMQACFSSLCEEVDTLMNKTIDRMKTRCDMKRSYLSKYFHELARAS